MPKPLQVPATAVRVEPRRTAPLIAGAIVLAGPSLTTTAVGRLVSVALPSGLEAVTRRRTIAPTSALTSAYVVWSAPEMFCHVVPLSLERCHW